MANSVYTHSIALGIVGFCDTATDEHEREAWAQPADAGDQIAFLQFQTMIVFTFIFPNQKDLPNIGEFR